MSLYTDATRCRDCRQKACLARARAEHLARRSRGGLVAYSCPVGQGWHVRTGRPDRRAEITGTCGRNL